MTIDVVDRNAIHAQPCILCERQFIVKTTLGIRLQLLLKHLFILRIPDRHVEGFTGEEMFILRFIERRHPGPRLELHLLRRPIDGSVGEGVNFRPLRHLIFLPIPNGIESKVGEPALRSGGGDHPLVAIGHGFFIPKKLPPRIGEFRKVLGLNVRLPLSILFLGVDVLLLISEDIQAGLAHRFSREGIGDEILHFAAIHLPDDDRIRHPQQHSGEIAIRHLCLQKISATRLQRRGDLHACVQVSIARLKLQIPLCHFLADIFLLPLLKDLITDILRLHALPVQSLGITLQIGFRVLQQLLKIHPAGTETHLRPIAKNIANLRALPGGLHCNIFQPAQLPSDARQLVLQLLDVGFVKIDRLAQHFHRPRELMAIFKNGRQFIGPADAEGTAGSFLCETLVDREIVEFLRQRESFRTRREPGARFIFLQRVQRQNRVLALRVLVLLPWPPPPIHQRVLAKLSLVELRKFHFGLESEISSALRQLRQQPAPALAIAGRGFP